jgi:hypothetical protein
MRRGGGTAITVGTDITTIITGEIQRFDGRGEKALYGPSFLLFTAATEKLSLLHSDVRLLLQRFRCGHPRPNAGRGVLPFLKKPQRSQRLEFPALS